MKTHIFIGLIAVLILFSGCTQPSPNTGQPSPNNDQPGSTLVCPQGLDAWASKTEFGNPATQFSSSDSIFITVKSDVDCQNQAKVNLFEPSGNLVSSQEYNIPKGATGYKNYNPSKNLVSGNYTFKIEYGGRVVTTIPITIVSSGTGTPSDNTGTPLSEQPDKTKFDEYFTRVYLGKLPLGVQVGPPNNFPVKTGVFTSADQFCSDFLIIKTIPAGTLGTAVYDTDKNEYTRPKANIPMELKQGGTSGCETMDFLPGKYEYKIYADDVLVSAIPFEVK
jgi:hypothetical protein